VHLHRVDSTLGTLRLYRNFTSPIRPARACTSAELSAFLSPECGLSTALFGGVSSGIALLLGSIPGRTTLSTPFWSFSTFRFPRSSHCSIGCPIQFSTHCFYIVTGVVPDVLLAYWFLLWVWVWSCTWMAVHAFLIYLARPVRSSRGW
jgi:hypothetical protein